MTEASYRNFILNRIAYWLSLSMLPSFAVISVSMVMFLRPEAPIIREMPVIMVSPDGKSTALWNGGDHANITAHIAKTAVEIANALFSNPRERSMTAAKVQRGSTFFFPKSIGERVYLSMGADAVEKSGALETSLKVTSSDVAYDPKAGDWSSVVQGTQVLTYENGTQEGRKVTLEILFKRADGLDRNENGRPVLIYNMRASYEK